MAFNNQLPATALQEVGQLIDHQAVHALALTCIIGRYDLFHRATISTKTQESAFDTKSSLISIDKRLKII